MTARVLVITGDRDPLASLQDVTAYMQEVGAVHKQHLYQTGVGHLPYVDCQAADVQKAIAALIDSCTTDVLPASQARKEHSQ